MGDVADFRSDLQRGQDGESRFHAKYPGLIRLDGTVADFKMTDGTLIELKTDSYNSSNFFMEFYSDKDKKTPGGPFQAFAKKVLYYVYWFPDQKNEEYWFKTAEIASFINANLSSFESREVKNTSWTTVGLLVPKSQIKHLAIVNPLQRKADAS